MRHSLKLWPLVLAMACSADLDSKDTADVIEPSVDCATEAPTAGAEVPLRRLTRAQLEATLLDSLNIVQAYPISDDELLGYRANTTSGLDTNTARTMQSAAEAVAVTLAPAVLRFEQCTDAGCADFLIDTAAPLLFRRPLPIEDRGPFYGVWDAGFEVGGRREAARWMLEAMLQSPRFLYQLETTDQEGWLDDYSVASRLSYALWGGPPDEFLLTAAAIGELHTDQQLTDAVDYFIESPKFERGMTQFVRQWLRLEELREETERLDLARLPSETRDALEQEPVAWVVNQVRQGGSVATLFTDSEGPAYNDLRIVYGQDWLSQSEGIVQLNPDRRSGILTLAGVQAAASHAQDTSPTRRGSLILSQLLCTPPTPPPENVSTTLPEPTEGQTKREQLQAHFDDPSCQGCHVTMDGLGFAYEQYDWFGRSRSTDGGVLIDTSVEVWWGGETLRAEGPIDLAGVLAERRAVSQCVGRHWIRFATSIPETDDAVCVIEDMGDAPTLRQMLLSYVLSDWFRKSSDTETD